MNGDFVRYRGLIAIAVSAGVAVGAAGVILYRQLFGERSHLVLEEDIHRLNQSVAELRQELIALRGEPSRKHSSLRSMRFVSITSNGDTEMISAGGEDGDDEFYEFSSETGNTTEEDRSSVTLEALDLLLEGITREDKIKAYGLLVDILDKGENNEEELLWRMAKACHMMSTLSSAEGDEAKMKEYLCEGVVYGQKAVDLNNGCWKSHKWFAVCVGSRGQHQSVKDKLRDGHTFKQHVDAAIAINPHDATLHHLMGRFNYEVANLSWLEKKIANALFGELPKGTYKQAIDSLLEAERLNPVAWKLNRVMLAKCFIGLNDFKEALRWLDNAKSVPAVSAEEKVAEKEIDALLAKYSSYRGLDA